MAQDPTDDPNGILFPFIVSALTIALMAVVQCLERRRERFRTMCMLNFAPSGRTSNSMSRRDSEESYFNRLRDNIRDLV
jgi:hypothetical protein